MYILIRRKKKINCASNECWLVPARLKDTWEIVMSHTSSASLGDVRSCFCSATQLQPHLNPNADGCKTRLACKEGNTMPSHLSWEHGHGYACQLESKSPLCLGHNCPPKRKVLGAGKVATSVTPARFGSSHHPDRHRR